ncbi:hypothetical protein Tco_0757214 [Tanacetum coccineum]
MSQRTIWRTSWHRHYCEKGLRAEFYLPHIFRDARKLVQINELDEMRLDAYESSISYKERIKRWHDKRIKAPTNYERGDKVLLFNSHLRLFPRKLKSRWYRPYSVCKDMKNSAIELYDEDGNKFIINKQRVKPYQKSVLDTNRDEDMSLDNEGEVTFLALGWLLEEIHMTWAHLEKNRQDTDLYQIHEEVLFTECRDDVAGIKRRHRDLVTASEI